MELIPVHVVLSSTCGGTGEQSGLTLISSSPALQILIINGLAFPKVQRLSFTMRVHFQTVLLLFLGLCASTMAQKQEMPPCAVSPPLRDLPRLF